MRHKRVILCVCLASYTNVFAGHQRFLTLENATLAQVKKWQQIGIAKPIVSDDGRVIYPYGQYLPKLTCTILRACDIQLEPGELLTGKPIAGDTFRWQMKKQISGVGEQAMTHIILKPTDVNIETNLMINTDRRTYQVSLYSSPNKKDYMNMIAWYYPEDMSQEWDDSAQIKAKMQHAHDRWVAAELPTDSIEKLDFSYSIEGDVNTRFKPVRVYNNGAKVYIQMPEGMTKAEAPILFLLGKDNQSEIVNYRLKTPALYEVDKLFDKAVLIVGTTGDEKKVLITWTKNQKTSFWPWSKNN